MIEKKRQKKWEDRWRQRHQNDDDDDDNSESRYRNGNAMLTKLLIIPIIDAYKKSFLRDN